MTRKAKTIKYGNQHWVKIRRSHAAMFGFERLYAYGILIDANATKIDENTFFHNCDPLGYFPICTYVEWVNCDFATDEFIMSLAR
jgi:hypothetical protein